MKNRSETFIEGLIAAVMCLWSFFGWFSRPFIFLTSWSGGSLASPRTMRSGLWVW